MPETFFSYLNNEMNRLDQALRAARASTPPDQDEIASLLEQRMVVDEQLVRWSRDLQDMIAA